ncbi:murein hydrolase activator EnvC family protein [Paenibacillus spongiae]|uniref:Peptidoglycan DD-metalloendopeptidase family protein n=1 Tax=Paenibacillus spongiae TaxID=2909671 RepID=A0ABY5S7I2_9BACL|nr:M23 family metallopeptidase [Paenibacillus spongiae]UVI29866.1 peptidoglycan DD-metalloendopeptidase family protein [Paenibacillus spongiae]
MRKWLAIPAVVVLAAFIFQPFGGEAASQVDKINKELDQVRKEISAAAHNRNQADKDRQVIIQQKTETAKSMQEVLTQIDEVGTQMMGVQAQLDAAEEKLLLTGEELQTAEERIATRDELLQSRLRLMYTNGSVSYLDVLLNATSFSDFIDRFDSLQSILGQDRDILESHKEDRELIAQKKKDVEKQLAEVKVMYGKLDSYQSLLVAKEKQKEVMVLSFNEQAEELEEISEEQEKLLISLAKKVSDLEEQKRKAAAKKKKKKVTPYYTGGKFAVPLQDGYRLSSPYGYRTHPISGKKKLHTGLDMAAPAGTPIYAAESGTVLIAQWWSGYGNTVIIDHGNGLWTLYGHIRNNGIKVNKGDTVKRGQKIAEVGSTGQSTGNHLHFEVRKNEEPVNPSQYLK